MKTNVKPELLKACENYVTERIDRIEKAIKDLEDALKLETKCSMGDKYETGRAMLHLEFEKLSAQHSEFLKLRQTLGRIDINGEAQVVRFGSLVTTGELNYFISIPAGVLEVNNEKFYAIGTNAPIAKAFLGKKCGEDVTFNGKILQIQEIL